jgi:hypothetical protein
MRLDPPDLGPVRVNLVSDGSELRGHVVVADDAVRRMIESQLPELRQRLEAAGVNVQRFDVTADPNAGGNRNPYRDAPPVPFEPGLTPRPAAAPIPPVRTRPAAGGLDVTV